MPPEPVSGGTTSVAVENASPEPRLFFATIWTRQPSLHVLLHPLVRLARGLAGVAVPVTAQPLVRVRDRLVADPGPRRGRECGSDERASRDRGRRRVRGLPPSVVTTEVAVDVACPEPCLLLAFTRSGSRGSDDAVVYEVVVPPPLELVRDRLDARSGPRTSGERTADDCGARDDGRCDLAGPGLRAGSSGRDDDKRSDARRDGERMAPDVVP